MRAFLAAFLAAIAIGGGSIAILNLFMQQPVATAFATTGARV